MHTEPIVPVACFVIKGLEVVPTLCLSQDRCGVITAAALADNYAATELCQKLTSKNGHH